MFTIICSLFSSIRQGFRTRAALHAEILALRHQLLVLQRSSRGHRLRLARPDRLLWVWLAHFGGGWRSALIIVKPETVIAWHQKGFRLYWRWKSRHRVGRPAVSREVIDLIRKMSSVNPRADLQLYWAIFAKSADPNGQPLPAWPRHDSVSQAYLEFTDDGPVTK